MCTQSGQATIGQHQAGHVNRHGRRKASRRRYGSVPSPDSDSPTSNDRTSSNRPSPCAGNIPHSYLKTSCDNPSSHAKDIEVKCLISGQSVSAVKCRHIVCLLLAYLAMAASAAEVAKNRYSEPSSTIIPTVKHQTVSVPNDKADSHIVSENGHVDVIESFTPLAQASQEDKLTSGIEKKDDTSLSSLYNDGANIHKKESLCFVLNIFHRYSSNNYLVKSDLEKLFVNIGLSSHAFINTSQVSLVNHGEEDIHNHTYHHHHELNQNTRTGDFSNPDGGKIYHSSGHSAAMVGTDSASENLQQNLSNSEQQQTHNLTTLSPMSSHGGNQRSIISSRHQHEQYNKCLSKDELLLMFRYEKLKQINADEFLHLCPALIDQLDAGYCRHRTPGETVPELKHSLEDHKRNHQRGHSHEGENNDQHTDGHDHEHNVDTPEHHGGVPAAAWIYALLSVAVISLCSVAGVVVIPNMKRVFYNHILQFLVALAVGAMSGDAMLHLFPHAMLSESHHDNHHHHDHNSTDPHDGDDIHVKSSHMVGMYKGLVALLGIYSFFFLERLFTLFTRNRSGRRDKKQKPRKRCHQQHKQRNQAFHMVNSRLENDGGNTPSCDEMVMVVHPNKALRAYADVSHEAYLHRCDESLVQPPSGDCVTTVLSHREDHGIRENSIILEGVTNTGLLPWNIGGAPSVSCDAEIVGISKDADALPSTHSHSHSHLAPDFVGPLSSVAMMIIVGDMIHNFCDGLAIGAAYAGNVAGGLSTSVAVFCHELPHEIGDFAVLVRSGLTMRKAVYFNLISSIPCFVGVIIGLTVGNAMYASSWIFAGVGGMFLYVTLVDLIPEMSSVYTKCGEPWFLHLLLQASGIAVGTTIMLIISVYEDSLLATFN